MKTNQESTRGLSGDFYEGPAVQHREDLRLSRIVKQEFVSLEDIRHTALSPIISALHRTLLIYELIKTIVAYSGCIFVQMSEPCG